MGGFPLNIVPKHGIGHPKVSRWTEWQVADYHPIRLTPVLLNYYDVREVMRPSSLNHLRNNLVTSIHSLGVWEHEFQLFRKGFQPGRGVARGCEKNFRLSRARVSILVVDVRSLHPSVVVFQLNLFPQLLLFSSELCWDGLPFLQCLPKEPFLLIL